MYTKLASIEINDQILSKVVGIWKRWAQNLSTNSKNVKNEVKTQKLLEIGFLEFLENYFSRNSRKKVILNFSRNFREGRSP
jgi:hypothetical protein